MENKTYKRTTVTSALPYANGGVHIGHLAGVYVPADMMSTVCPSRFVPVRRVSRLRMSSIAITR